MDGLAPERSSSFVQVAASMEDQSTDATNGWSMVGSTRASRLLEDEVRAARLLSLRRQVSARRV
eukprot:1871892-Prorocentrum_lima.AAC.1